jgi:hypothetical protein
VYIMMKFFTKVTSVKFPKILRTGLRATGPGGRTSPQINVKKTANGTMVSWQQALATSVVRVLMGVRTPVLRFVVVLKVFLEVPAVLNAGSFVRPERSAVVMHHKELQDCWEKSRGCKLPSARTRGGAFSVGNLHCLLLLRFSLARRARFRRAHVRRVAQIHGYKFPS